MNILFRSTSLLVAVVCIVGCASAPQVFTDSDPLQSFDDYRSFSWISDDPMMLTGDRAPSTLVVSRLQEAIKSTLEQKGVNYVEQKSEADFVVAYTVGARDKMDIQQSEIIDYYGEHWRWGYEYYGYLGRRGTNHIGQFSATIELVDPGMEKTA